MKGVRGSWDDETVARVVLEFEYMSIRLKVENEQTIVIDSRS